VDGYAKQQVAELLGRIAFFVDQKNTARLSPCFHKDARFVINMPGDAEDAVFDGHAAIMAMMQKTVDGQTDQRRHFISNIWYESTGEKVAEVVSYMQLLSTEHAETKSVATGWYRDKVVRDSIDGGWSIRDRTLSLDRVL
jgi:3-phenylpropionate/cinnamic acid dioxygenase small subunit